MKYPMFACLGEQYPFALEQQYERILKKIVELWDTQEIDAYFSDLVIDTRGGRQGFPRDVLNDIMRLREYCESSRLNEAERQVDAMRELDRRGILFKEPRFLQAVNEGDQALVDLFIRAGINVHAADDQGTPAVLIALKRGYTVIAGILINAGANVNARDKLGLTPLLLACGKTARGFREIAENLIRLGADINVRDPLGWTPLLLALSGGTADIAEMLILRGADVTARNRKGVSALALAEAAGRDHVVELLRERGARR